MIGVCHIVCSSGCPSVLTTLNDLWWWVQALTLSQWVFNFTETHMLCTGFGMSAIVLSYDMIYMNKCFM